MGADEIRNWMAYELSNTTEFQEYLDNIPVKCDTPEQEAQAIKNLLMGLSKK